MDSNILVTSKTRWCESPSSEQHRNRTDAVNVSPTNSWFLQLRQALMFLSEKRSSCLLQSSTWTLRDAHLNSPRFWPRSWGHRRSAPPRWTGGPVPVGPWRAYTAGTWSTHKRKGALITQLSVQTLNPQQSSSKWRKTLHKISKDVGTVKIFARSAFLTE